MRRVHKDSSFLVQKGSEGEVKGKRTYCPVCPNGIISSFLPNITSLSLPFHYPFELRMNYPTVLFSHVLLWMKQCPPIEVSFSHTPILSHLVNSTLDSTFSEQYPIWWT